MTGAADRHTAPGATEAALNKPKNPNHKQLETPDVKTIFKQLGPGLVTGASDDDPSGIGTYSQVGARFGYGMLWTMLLSYPLMAAIQEISARIGRVTGGGLAANLRRYYPKCILYSVLTLMSLANIFNLGADLGAMAAAASLLLPGDSRISKFEVTREYLTALIAVLGTTISPYLFFWQASQEVEEVACNPGEEALKQAPRQARSQLGRIRLDTYVGMALSNVVAFFIILTTAATLHAHGIHEISSSAQAALALKPLAGRYAFLLFVCGIVGTGLLAVPVLAGSAAYGIGEARRWRVGLERKPQEAVRFYGAIVAATLVGGALNFYGIDPIKALFWAAVLNGMVAAPLMVVIMIMASSKKVMGKFVIPRYLRLMGWIATGVMVCVCLGVFATWK